MVEELERFKAEALAKLAELGSEAEAEAWRLEYLGRRSRLQAALSSIGSLPPEERPVVGQAANSAKVALETAFRERLEALRAQEAEEQARREPLDVTLPGRRPELGQLHVVTQILDEIEAVFARLGFDVVEGPEVEWDYYNFEALNIPKEHPARDMWDTFWLDMGEKTGEILLRTHTSPVQARVMERRRPPVRVIVPGRCYRYEATDATHESIFYQVEGLAVDEGITMADLRGVLTTFARELFGRERRVRFRCDYFPFVEPGVDMSMSCHMCDGTGCRICKYTGWIEILGAGMVHPRVLEGVGYDSTRYSGFAFGMGPERIAMLKYGIEDIRLFYQNDLRFLRQFR